MTREISLGNIKIGNNNPISIQSMTTTKTVNVTKTVGQILELEKSGCDIVRVAVPDYESVKSLKPIIEEVNVPIVADIHFDGGLAIESLRAGVHGIRINPGNLAKVSLDKIVDEAKLSNACIRIGVNGGSLEKDILKKYGDSKAEALIESAIRYVDRLEKMNFTNFKISVKTSDVRQTVETYRRLSKLTNAPLHIGVTESGTAFAGTVKSSIGIGSLLLDGIGDTIRVSLTDDPLEEVRVAKSILVSLGLRKGVQVISCPTCGRCSIALIDLAKEVEQMLEDYSSSIKVAVMGCIVNGPGEAREADVGIAGGDGKVAIFRMGRVVKTVDYNEALDSLREEILVITKGRS